MLQPVNLIYQVSKIFFDVMAVLLVLLIVKGSDCIALNDINFT